MGKNLLAEFSYVDKTRGLRSGDDGPTETRFEKPGELYRFCLKEYGRCTGNVYVKRQDGKQQRIGWVFEKRVKYSDCNEYFLQETWVSVHTAEPDRKVTYHYAEL